ncbi:ricin-type beta-trefoil lectin domain protein [Micromonospora sicca]|uniref:ricin-type beta-trefoil lectin domain protein n=1 Tax=Micromonospora sicca TaxID=2202420 RepID=UPI001374B891|nr:RICIN domain-containing protein [Micromonospora sp. 4G51]
MLAVGVVLALTANLLTQVPASAAPKPKPAGQSQKPVPTRKVKPRAAAKAQTDGRGITRLGNSVLPKAGSATVAVSGRKAKVGELPVVVSPLAPVSVEDEQRAIRQPELTPTSVTMRVLNRKATKAAGVSGALLSVSRADGARGPGKVRLAVDYARFANAYGGDYAGRLRLVALPACALTTPADAQCRVPRDLAAVRAGTTLTADVTLAGAEGASVLALTAGSSSAGGTFQSTNMSQAYSWAAGNQSGSFTYSYPLPIPPAGVGPQPNLALTYDSGRVDGQTSTQNGQTSWVGEGWDLQIGYVERSYRPCSQDGLQNVNDLCAFSPHNATLVFAGKASPLVRDNTTGTWRAASDDGLRIEKFDSTNWPYNINNGDNDNEFWRVTTQDGVQYYFGVSKRYSNDNESTNSVQTVPVIGNNPGEPCPNGCSQAYRWNLDYVVDPHNNSMTYGYTKQQGTYAGAATSTTYDIAAQLDYIDYGDRVGNEHAQRAPMRVEFDVAERCNAEPCLNADGTPIRDKYPDTPWDLYCEVGLPCGNFSPNFLTTKRLAAIRTMVLDESVPPQWRTVDEWKLTHTYPDTYEANTSPHLWLQSIEHTGHGVDGATKTELKMEFGGTRLANRVDSNPSAGVPQYMHYRLTSATNGSGGNTLIEYTNLPEGGVACDPTWAPIPDNNPYLCFPQRHHTDNPDPNKAGGFAWFNKYLVNRVTQRDLTGGSPDEITTYKYVNTASSDSALWAHDVNESVELLYRSWSVWRGYSSVTATKATASAQTINRNIYHRGMDGDGKTTGDGTGVAWYEREAALLTPIGTPGLDGAISGQGGKCLDIKLRGTANGTLVHMWDCYDTWSQVWQWQPDGHIKNPYSGKCLDIADYNTANGATVQIWDCVAGNWNQKWQPQPNGSLKNPNSTKCLDIYNFSAANGTKVQTWSCGGNWNQVFQPQANQSLLNPQANRCIDVANSATVNGTVIQARRCNGAANEVWQVQTDGKLKNPNSTRCLDIKGPSTTTGSLIHLWDCYATWSQVWEQQPDGSLKNPQSNKCLDASPDATGSANGQLVLYDCDATRITQKWTNRFNDADGLNGFLRESIDLDGAQVAASTIHIPATTQTGMRPTPVTGGQDLYAQRVTETSTRTRTWIAADGKWRWTEAQASYDTYGLPTDTRDLGDISTASDDTCLRAEYARNTTAYLIAFPYQTTEYAGACGSATILFQSRTYYDTSTTLGTAPTKGEKTKNQSLVKAPDTWAITEATYDPRGRPATKKDARGLTTTTAYNPTENLPLKGITVSKPISPQLNHVVKTDFDPGRALPTVAIDPNGRQTVTDYDPLGRRAAVWLPTEKKSGGDPPSMKYAYDIRSDAPSKLTTQALQTRPTATTGPVYLTSYQFLDGRMRPRNNQSMAPGGVGRIITETTYDSRGQVATETGPYYNVNAAGSALNSAAAADLPSRSVYSYDNLGRTTAEALEANGVEKWRNRHSYDGDRHTLIPASGGNSTTYYDAAGRTTRLTVNPTTGTSETTTYGYNTADELTTITDAADNITRYGYDLAGNRTSVQDPDTGSSISTYNAMGDLLSTTDARGQKISYQYDALGRPTVRWAGDVVTGTKLTTYLYDGANATNGITAATGMLTSTIRHVGNANYVVEPTGYDDRYRPTGTRWIIPQAEGDLAGTYTVNYGYDSADHLTTLTYPARAGLPSETLTTGYDTLGYATTLTGVNNYVTATGYTTTGQLASRTYGDPGAGQLIRNYSWESATGRLSTISATLPDPALPGTRKTVQDDLYTYQPAGDIASVKDRTDGQSQCYRYDGLHRLTEAFTATDDCAANPVDVAATGKQPYWDSYTFDTAGRRATDTHQTGTATTSRTYTYPAKGQPQVHGMASIAVTGSTTRTDTFAYDLAGNMRTRTVAGVKTDYTVNAEGRFDTATVTVGTGTEQTKHLYDADGTLLIRTEPTGKSLYLGGEELRLDGKIVTGTRYYSHDSAAVAVRTKDGLDWIAADHQASANLMVDPLTGALQRRWYTPYGADRAGAAGWPTDRGFLNAPANTSTKLLDVGVREYDPDTGTFIAPDPLVDPANPNSLNPFAYAHHNPITLSDPTGLAPGWMMGIAGDGELSDADKAIMVTVGTGVVVAAFCFGTGGTGCLLMAASAMVVTGIAAASAPEGQRFQAAQDGAAAAVVGVGVGALLVRTGGIIASARYRTLIAVAAAGASEDATYQALATGEVNWRQTAQAAAIAVGFYFGGKIIGKVAGKLRRGVPCDHSFAPATPVLMADGTTKAIKDVELGDKVLATDPETGAAEVKEVEQLHLNHDSELTDLTVQVEDSTPPADGGTSSAAAVLHTTQTHPFWDQTLNEWVEAGHLVVGHRLQTSDGDTVTVTKVRNYTGGADMHDLTVADIHTYYVVADATPILVHNCGREYAITKYSDKAPGMEQHHGVMDAWAKHNIPGYKSRAADSTTIQLSKANHDATKAVYRDWLEARTGRRVGAKVDWSSVSSREIFDLSERMFDAASVPQKARDAYYTAFDRYIHGLGS